MNQRGASENSKAVSLFPFLAVLLCTMGALLVLLVVLAQRAGERAASKQLASPKAPEHSQPIAPENLDEATELRQQLETVRTNQQELNKLQEKYKQRLLDEQNRLSHLEEHARRIEHELARLSIAAQQLEATEKNQSVDQEQAERELARLHQLIKDTEKQIVQLREEASGTRSYAIVPYKGPNGTYRQPIYIECCKEGVIIRPEGIQFESSDFAATKWPGNPLAAALRASREYLNAKAARAGEPVPPDPYPLLIVRPDGVAQYQKARAALTSWDADFGYEFINGDWKLDFPDLPDPLLAQAQNHALLNARAQLARLARSAPRKFHVSGFGSGSSIASGGTSGSKGYGAGGPHGESNNYGALAQSAAGQSSEGNGNAAGQSEGGTGTEPGDFQHGATSGDANANGQNAGPEFLAEGMAGGTGGESSTPLEGASGEFGQGGNQSQGSEQGASSLAQSGTQGGSSTGTSNTGSSGGAASGGQPSSSAATMGMTMGSTKSIAKSRGKNWAIAQKTRGAVPIRRPIRVVVRKDRLALLPSRHASEGIEATGTVISLKQPTKQISDAFVEALRTRVEQWGLAGNGMYWRPVLELNIEHEAEETARGITQLLHNSGVEVSLPETAMRR